MVMLPAVIPPDWATTVEIITPELLKESLVRWQQARQLPAALFDLQLLTRYTPPSPVVRSLWFYDYCFAVTEDQLKTCRMAVNLPHPDPLPLSRQVLKAQFAQDFNTDSGTTELSAWSALFHRHFLPVRIPPSALAQAAGISERTMRRHRQLGLAYLAQYLRRAELTAYQIAVGGTTGSARHFDLS